MNAEKVFVRKLRTIRLESTCHLMRDTQDGTQRMVPTKRRVEVLHYWLGVKQQEYGLVLHQWLPMSTHSHLVYNDPGETIETARRRQERRHLRPGAELKLGDHDNDHIVVPIGPSFYEDLHSRWAYGINKLDRVSGKVMGDDQCPLVMVRGLRAEIDNIAYVRVNPTEGGIVENPYDWPGFGFGMGGEETFEDEVVYRVERPEGVHESYPEVVFVTYTPQDELKDRDRDWVRQAIRERIQERTEEAIKKREGKPFLGRELALSADPLETIEESAERRSRASRRRRSSRGQKNNKRRAPEVDSNFAEKRRARLTKKKGNLDLRVKTCDPELREEELAWIERFRSQYASAMHKLKRQVEGAVFPKGSYKVALYCGANVDMS